MPRTVPTTTCNTPRYGSGPILEDIDGINLEDIDGVVLLAIDGAQVNIIETIWN